ncbi:hypothetical protein N657DRAFT_162909 [Parathielavia appendiculata]|uniref:Uncharacterized protein n=1 Tax=Parathielavia appendiculata TaxID=2587402 RepID=A0AAN6Z171_9PEZI|nr:hypothetical protein N657DRAFT_162909 [Parathielavia appendiculata]
MGLVVSEGVLFAGHVGRAYRPSPLLLLLPPGIWQLTDVLPRPDKAYGHWNLRNLGYQVLAEAKRLWEVEITSGRVRLTTLRASSPLHLVHHLNAMDRVSFSLHRASHGNGAADWNFRHIDGRG